MNPSFHFSRTLVPLCFILTMAWGALSKAESAPDTSGPDANTSYQSCQQALTSDAKSFSVQVGVDGDGTPVLSFAGDYQLDLENPDAFETALAPIPVGSNLILSLNSKGEKMTGGHVLKGLLQARIRPHRFRTSLNGHLTTYVANGAECTGPCLELFMMGDTRIAHPSSRFGFKRLIPLKAQPKLSAAKASVAVLKSWNVRGILLENLYDWGALAEETVPRYRRPYKLDRSNILTVPPQDFGIPPLALP